MVPKMGKSIHEPFKSGVCFLEPFGSPGCESFWFSKPDILGAHFSGAPRVGVPDMGLKPLASLEYSPYLCNSLLLVGCHTGG